MTSPLDPQQVAERCAAIMWPDDRAAQGLGIELVRVAPGEAVASMRVRDDMVNGHDTCHGGFIFALADTAFAYACNTFNPDCPLANFRENEAICDPPSGAVVARVLMDTIGESLCESTG